MKIVKKIIGVMSGTSLDGIDLTEVLFKEENNLISFDILKATTKPYPENWMKKLKEAVNYSDSELDSLNQEYTKYLGTVISEFISENQITDIDFVSSHGHTILHQPDKGITLQIGNLPEISSYVNQKVICDFRVQDVMLKGQGAPLVPIGDRILFSEYDYCLNLGGFSNISFESNGKRIAYDISPVNTVLNFYANKFGFDYDDKGELAKSGIFNKKLFEELNKIEFYSKSYPKSLGVEFVNQQVFLVLSKYNDHEILTTFTEHVAFQISKNITLKESKILITGGGVYNDFLIERIKFYLKENIVIIPDKKIIEFKEALIFALLGYLKSLERVNVLSSVTGAVQDHVSGVVFS